MTADFLDTGFLPILSFEVSMQLKSPPITKLLYLVRIPRVVGLVFSKKQLVG